MANSKNTTNGASLGIESQLFAAADKLRGHLDAAEYKNVVLGLIFLKYISDAFEQYHAILQKQSAQGADPEDRDEYISERIFWVPKEARWTFLRGSAKQPNIGNLIDEAMLAIERDNPALKGVLPGSYGRASLDKQKLGGLVDLVSGINFVSEESRKQDVLGRVYEYFLSQFASLEGKRGGEFYTPRSVVRVLVEMIAPYKGRIFDPCCGSGGMFVQSEKFIEAHGGRIGDLTVYGQESNPNTWKLAKMNLGIRGLECDLGKEPADSFLRDLHPDLKADFILANPPFNMSDWGGAGLREDKRWKYGAPPVGNANYAWVQHFIHHLSPNGTAGFVLANGSMSSSFSGEGDIRRAMIEDDLVDCMIAMPGQLFYSVQIPVCLWFVTRNKHDGKSRDRRGETLFIDARKMGRLVDRTHRDLTDEDIERIAGTYHAWKGVGAVEGRVGEIDAAGRLVGARYIVPQRNIVPQRTGPQRDIVPQPNEAQPTLPNIGQRPYADEAGFCKGVTVEEIRVQGYVLTPGRYVGAADVEEGDEEFDIKMDRLTNDLFDQFVESEKLEQKIRKNLMGLGHGK